MIGEDRIRTATNRWFPVLHVHGLMGCTTCSAESLLTKDSIVLTIIPNVAPRRYIEQDFLLSHLVVENRPGDMLVR